MLLSTHTDSENPHPSNIVTKPKLLRQCVMAISTAMLISGNEPRFYLTW